MRRLNPVDQKWINESIKCRSRSLVDANTSEQLIRYSEIKALLLGKVTESLQNKVSCTDKSDDLFFSIVTKHRTTLDFQVRYPRHRDEILSTLNTAGKKLKKRMRACPLSEIDLGVLSRSVQPTQLPIKKNLSDSEHSTKKVTDEPKHTDRESSSVPGKVWKSQSQSEIEEQLNREIERRNNESNFERIISEIQSEHRANVVERVFYNKLQSPTNVSETPPFIVVESTMDAEQAMEKTYTKVLSIINKQRDDFSSERDLIIQQFLDEEQEKREDPNPQQTTTEGVHTKRVDVQPKLLQEFELRMTMLDAKRQGEKAYTNFLSKIIDSENLSQKQEQDWDATNQDIASKVDGRGPEDIHQQDTITTSEDVSSEHEKITSISARLMEEWEARLAILQREEELIEHKMHENMYNKLLDMITKKQYTNDINHHEAMTQSGNTSLPKTPKEQSASRLTEVVESMMAALDRKQQGKETSTELLTIFTKSESKRECSDKGQHQAKHVGIQVDEKQQRENKQTSKMDDILQETTRKCKDTILAKESTVSTVCDWHLDEINSKIKGWQQCPQTKESVVDRGGDKVDLKVDGGTINAAFIECGDDHHQHRNGYYLMNQVMESMLQTIEMKGQGLEMKCNGESQRKLNCLSMTDIPTIDSCAEFQTVDSYRDAESTRLPVAISAADRIKDVTFKPDYQAASHGPLMTAESEDGRSIERWFIRL